MITMLDHVQLAMPVGAENEARSFYAGVLGLKEIEKPAALQSRGGVWFALNDGRQLHLGVEEDFRPSKKAHPCFVTDQLDHLAEKLTAAGHPVQHDDLIPPIRRFFTCDACGNRVEFCDRPGNLVARSNQ